MPEIKAKHWAGIGLLGLIWGAAFMSTSVALRGFEPFTLAAGRIALGALFLLGLLRVTGRRLPRLSDPKGGLVWVFAIAMALFSNAIPFTFLGWGQKYVASGFAGVCMAVVPLLILPLAHVFVPGEGFTLRRFVGFVLGTAGVIVLIGPAAFDTTGQELELLAKLACVGAACCYAIGSICTRLCPDVDRVALSAAVLLVAALIMVPMALTAEGLPQEVDRWSLFAIIYLGVLPTGVAQVVLVIIAREAGPVFLSLVNYMVPVWSIILGVLVLSETLPPSLLSGMALILVGVGLAQFGALKRTFFGG